ncbi:DUF1283 family protein [Acerihabitans arboris]|uniref:UPF0482 protein GRH90_10320 n=1 Tax=Acerihabitans arboris TaxID=2691583 RepID=A0A845SEB9_9GAMM|nr:DUF1283 family protein [Acerihabitans arboris]NDL63140.1 DUF1283 family protein [Acerihabitans arboris]
MNTTSYQRLLGGMLSVALLAFSTTGYAASNTQRLIIDSGDNAQSREDARQSQEQWNATHNLRSKVNQRDEKDFDKYDKTVDLRERCNSSDNVNAYWEDNTARCLDRRTGRSLMAP